MQSVSVYLIRVSIDRRNVCNSQAMYVLDINVCEIQIIISITFAIHRFPVIRSPALKFDNGTSCASVARTKFRVPLLQLQLYASMQISVRCCLPRCFSGTQTLFNSHDTGAFNCYNSATGHHNSLNKTATFRRVFQRHAFTVGFHQYVRLQRLSENQIKTTATRI